MQEEEKWFSLLKGESLGKNHGDCCFHLLLANWKCTQLIGQQEKAIHLEKVLKNSCRCSPQVNS